jgi:hypothetical protein
MYKIRAMPLLGEIAMRATVTQRSWQVEIGGEIVRDKIHQEEVMFEMWCGYVYCTDD